MTAVGMTPEQARKRVHDRALRRLSHLYPSEYERLRREELARLTKPQETEQ